MAYSHYAAIDIGSNAVRLLIKRLEDDRAGLFSKTVMMRVPLRLGQEVFTTGKIHHKKVDDLVDVMKAYSIILNMYKIPDGCFRACATASFREASNADQVIEKIRKKTDISVDVISGDEEAATFCSVNARDDDPRTLVLVDVGGGSTEVSLVRSGTAFCRKSYPVGTVKIINGIVSPDWRGDLAREMKAMAYDFSSVQAEGFHGATIVGSGGNINKLFEIVPERDAAEHIMSVAALRNIYGELERMTVAQRMATYNLKADRADVIVPAAEIFLVVASALSISEIEIPTVGLADGIIAKLWKKNHAKALFL